MADTADASPAVNLTPLQVRLLARLARALDRMTAIQLARDLNPRVCARGRLSMINKYEYHLDALLKLGLVAWARHDLNGCRCWEATPDGRELAFRLIDRNWRSILREEEGCSTPKKVEAE